jgi:hypothetical protein
MLPEATAPTAIALGSRRLVAVASVAVVAVVLPVVIIAPAAVVAALAAVAVVLAAPAAFPWSAGLRLAEVLPMAVAVAVGSCNSAVVALFAARVVAKAVENAANALAPLTMAVVFIVLLAIPWVLMAVAVFSAAVVPTLLVASLAVSWVMGNRTAGVAPLAGAVVQVAASLEISALGADLQNAVRLRSFYEL